MDDYKLKILSQKREKLEQVVKDESLPKWKRLQAETKLYEFNKRYFPKIFHNLGTYRKKKKER